MDTRLWNARTPSVVKHIATKTRTFRTRDGAVRQELPQPAPRLHINVSDRQCQEVVEVRGAYSIGPILSLCMMSINRRIIQFWKILFLQGRRIFDVTDDKLGMHQFHCHYFCWYYRDRQGMIARLRMSNQDGSGGSLQIVQYYLQKCDSFIFR